MGREYAIMHLIAQKSDRIWIELADLQIDYSVLSCWRVLFENLIKKNADLPKIAIFMPFSAF